MRWSWAWRINAIAQQLIGPRRADVIGLADLGHQPGADVAQLGYRRIDRIHRVRGTAPGVRVGLAPGFPDGQPDRHGLDAAAERRQGRV